MSYLARAEGLVNRIILKIRHKDSPTIQAKYHICDNDTAILGLRPSLLLGLVQINCSIATKDTRKVENIVDLANEYLDRFQGISNFSGKQKIHINENTTPVVQTQSKYPIYFKDELKKELHKMENMGMIEKVIEPTDWINATAYSRKRMES